MDTQQPALSLPPAIINRIDASDDTVTVLLGFSKYLFRGFERNNIQMVGNWYLENVDHQSEEIAAYIREHSPKFVNLVGTSKSCTGAFIFADRLARIFPKTTFRIFAFSAYTRLDRDYYEAAGTIDFLPESLVGMWDRPDTLALVEKYKDAIDLLHHPNIRAYMIYPARSRGTEPDAAKRVSHLKNVTLIPLRVRIHSVIFPFWKMLTPDAKIETFEGLKPTRLKPEVYSYFHAMQTDPWYRFSIYTMLFETPRFRQELARFHAKLE